MVILWPGKAKFPRLAIFLAFLPGPVLTRSELYLYFMAVAGGWSATSDHGLRSMWSSADAFQDLRL